MNFARKFSIGFPPDLKFEDWKSFVDSFHPYIHDVYSSPIGDNLYHSRMPLWQYLEHTEANLKHFVRCISYACSKGASFNLAINTVRLLENNVDILNSIELMSKYLEIDQITTLTPYADIISKQYPDVPLLSSYNNIGYDDRFTQVVLGGKNLRDRSLFTKISNEGFEVKLLLNNGCHFNCPGICMGKKQSTCQSVAEQNVASNSINYLYALQSVMPFELHDYLINFDIDLFKINSRLLYNDQLEDVMKSYIENDNQVMFPSRFLRWGSLAMFHQHIEEIEINEVMKYKEKIWAALPLESEFVSSAVTD
ncbi:MAG: hypothetical protein ABFS19_02160 [Thermodesulfobacteriota bacterium]